LIPTPPPPQLSVQTRVAATTSNLGPGFDTLGIALKLYNRTRLTPNGTSRFQILSPLTPATANGATTMVEEAASLYFRHTRQQPLGCDVFLDGDVPIARGLGSSVTVRLGVIAGLDALCHTHLAPARFLDLLTELEHHPDNAAPAVLGGFTVAGMLDASVRCIAVAVSPRARFVALIPSFEISTQMARKLVPGNFTRADTLHNLNRAALISAAFASNNLAALPGLFEDRVHQPYRQQLIPQLSRVIHAGVDAGALGGWLSGSGSTIICLTLRNPKSVATAMLRELPDAHIRILSAENDPYRVSHRAIPTSPPHPK
jgi:homoserine kinase